MSSHSRKLSRKAAGTRAEKASDLRRDLRRWQILAGCLVSRLGGDVVINSEEGDKPGETLRVKPVGPGELRLWIEKNGQPMRSRSGLVDMDGRPLQ
jgi:hypothetical protein